MRAKLKKEKEDFEQDAGNLNIALEAKQQELEHVSGPPFNVTTSRAHVHRSLSGNALTASKG